MSFTKENSPLKVRILIVYSFDENFNDKKTYELDAYVKRFSNWNTNEFTREERYKRCEDDNYYKFRNVTETYSPMRYYIKYNLP